MRTLTLKQQLGLAALFLILFWGVFSESSKHLARQELLQLLVKEVPKPEVQPLPDFASYRDVDQLKSEFFDYLQPIVEYHNQVIQLQRQILLAIAAKYDNGDILLEEEMAFVRGLAEGYDVDLEQLPLLQALDLLERRVDVIPRSLVLVQAAKESGWGRSRFAVEANNLFGQWCYSEGCGLVPSGRVEGANNEVQYFDSVDEAIASYMNNLNTHYSYLDFRLIRESLREEEEPLSGEELAEGLLYYSQRREAYVEEIKTMLDQYHEFQAQRAEADQAVY